MSFDLGVLPLPFLAQDGATGLFIAAEEGHLEVVRLLLDSRSDPNAADKVRGHTAAPWRAHAVSAAPFPSGPICAYLQVIPAVPPSFMHRD